MIEHIARRGGWPVFWPLPTLPIDADFSWVNQGAASKSTALGGGITIVDPVVAGTNERLLVKTAPSTPYTITAMITATFLANSGGPHAGICFRESSSGKIHYCSIQDDSNGATTTNGRLYSAKMDSATSFNATYQAYMFPIGFPIWLRITDNGTNRLCSFSRDGVNFIQFHSIGRTDFLTANQVGFIVGNSSAFEIAATLHSWKET